MPLLDTHAFLWWAWDDPKLSSKARKTISRAADCYLSVASCWEMALKISLGKLKLPTSFQNYIPEQMAANGFRELPVEFRHTTHLVNLPVHHRDPFDRLLIAQALEEKLPIISMDEAFDAYGVRRIW